MRLSARPPIGRTAASRQRFGTVIEGGAPLAVLRPGDQFAQFRLERLLGSDGGSPIWLAIDRGAGALDRLVRLHLLRAGSSGHESNTSSGLSGLDPRLVLARRMAALDSPHLVGVHGIGHDDGLAWVTTQWSSGMTLDVFRQRLVQVAPLEAPPAVVRGVAVVPAAAGAPVIIAAAPAGAIVGGRTRSGFAPTAAATSTAASAARWRRTRGIGTRRGPPSGTTEKAGDPAEEGTHGGVIRRSAIRGQRRTEFSARHRAARGRGPSPLMITRRVRLRECVALSPPPTQAPGRTHACAQSRSPSPEGPAG